MATKLSTSTTSNDLPVLGTCHNCQGLGILEHFGHVAGGTCFTCNGDGFKLYMVRRFRGMADKDLPRDVRLHVIKSALDAYAWIDEDEFLRRYRKARRRFLANLITRMACASDPRVFDRAFAALHKVHPRDAAKVAALREKTFGAVVTPAA